MPSEAVKVRAQCADGAYVIVGVIPALSPSINFASPDLFLIQLLWHGGGDFVAYHHMSLL